MYQDFEVEYRNGVKRIFHETATDVRNTASFYTPSFGPIKTVKAVKAPKSN